MNPHLSPADYDALAAFRYELRKFFRFSKNVLLAEAEITPEQYEVLLALKARSGSAGLMIRDVSERLQVRHHTAVALVAKLVDRGLVRRTPGKTDRRQVLLRLSEAGERVLAKVAPIHRRELRTRSVDLIEVLSRLQK